MPLSKFNYGVIFITSSQLITLGSLFRCSMYTCPRVRRVTHTLSHLATMCGGSPVLHGPQGSQDKERRCRDGRSSCVRRRTTARRKGIPEAGRKQCGGADASATILLILSNCREGGGHIRNETMAWTYLKTMISRPCKAIVTWLLHWLALLNVRSKSFRASSMIHVSTAIYCWKGYGRKEHGTASFTSTMMVTVVFNRC